MHSTQNSNSALIINGGGRSSSMAEAEAEWSWSEDKIFEEALVKFPDDSAERWEKIAGQLPGKSVGDVMAHYEALVEDVAAIEGGHIEVPSYTEARENRRRWVGSSSQYERKKGKPWTVEEHKLFLRGLEIYGKSDWRSISRNVVITRLPSQVASHAQKFFKRMELKENKKKRSSIHDITSPHPHHQDHTHFSLPHTSAQSMTQTTFNSNSN